MKINLDQLYAAHKAQQCHETRNALWEAIYIWNHARLRDDDIASECTQRAMDHLGSYDPAEGSIEPWIKTISFNLHRDKRIEDTNIVPIDDPDAIGGQVVFPQSISLDLGVISDTTTRALCQHVLDGSTIAQAADAVGMSRPAAYKRLNRLGRNILPQCLIRR